MTPIPKAAIEAAVSSYMESMAAEGFISHEGLSAAFEKVLLAALPHLGEPVAWTGSGSLKEISSEREGYIWPQKADAHPIPLYLAPPAPAVPEGWKLVPIEPVEGDGWTVDASVLAGRILSHLGYSTSPSLELGADERRDRIAAIIYEGMLAFAPEPPVASHEMASGDTQQTLPVTDDAQGGLVRERHEDTRQQVLDEVLGHIAQVKYADEFDAPENDYTEGMAKAYARSMQVVRSLKASRAADKDEAPARQIGESPKGGADG